MPARPYRASGKSEPGALSVLLIGSTGLAVIFGIAESFLSQWFNLLLVFPAIIGFAAGALASKQIRTRRIRAPVTAALFALSAAWIGQATLHGVDYWRFRNRFVGEIESKRQSLLQEHADNPEDVKEIQALDAVKLADDQLEKKTGSRGFQAYLKIAAEQGFTISHHGSKGPQVSGIGTWLFWLFDFIVAGGVAFFIAFERANKPFCETCKRWYDKEAVTAVGSPEAKNWKPAQKALDVRDWQGFANNLGQPTPKAASLLLLERCSTCEEHEPLMTFVVKSRMNTNKPQTAKKYQTLVRSDEVKLLLNELESRKASGAAAPEKAAT
jgi:hypothetical protein